MSRCLEGSHRTTISIEQDSEEGKYKDQEEKLPEAYSHRMTGMDRTFDAWKSHWPEGPASELYSVWTTGALRTSDQP